MPTPRQSDLVAMASRLLEVPTVRYHKTDTNSMSRSRKPVAVEEPKEHEQFRCPHLPVPAALRSRGVWRRMRKARIRRPEIWLACQRSVTTAAGCRTGSECPMKSASILVYIVGGIREILTSVEPLELRHL